MQHNRLLRYENPILCCAPTEKKSIITNFDNFSHVILIQAYYKMEIAIMKNVLKLGGSQDQIEIVIKIYV